MFDWLRTIFVTTDKEYRTKRIPQLIRGKEFSLDNALTLSTVYTCIDYRARNLAKLPLEIYKEDPKQGKIKDKDSYLYPILHFSPNNYTSIFNFIYAVQLWMDFKGNGFAHIHRNKKSGRVESLEVFNPGLILSYKIVNGLLSYEYEKKGNWITAENILHFRMMTKDGVWGMNPIEALRYNLSVTYKGLNTIDNFYNNNAAIPKVIKSTVSNANQSRLLEAVDQFNKEFAGSEEAGKIAALPPNTEIQTLGLSYEDAQFIQTIKFNANQIAAVFGVPSHIVGNTETSKYNNVEQMNIGYKGDTASSLARMYRQEFELKLLTEKDIKQNKSIEFNLKALIETDFKTRIEGYQKLIDRGVMSPNEVAKIENLPTSENGDIRMVPMNMMEISKLKDNEK